MKCYKQINSDMEKSLNASIIKYYESIEGFLKGFIKGRRIENMKHFYIEEDRTIVNGLITRLYYRKKLIQVFIWDIK